MKQKKDKEQKEREFERLVTPLAGHRQLRGAQLGQNVGLSRGAEHLRDPRQTTPPPSRLHAPGNGHRPFR